MTHPAPAPRRAESPLETATRLVALKRSALRQASAGVLLRLLRKGRARRLEPGETLLARGARAHGFWLITGGRVDVLVKHPGDEAEHRVAQLGSEETVGLEQLLGDTPAPATYRASPTFEAAALFFDREDVETVLRGARQATPAPLVSWVEDGAREPEVMQLVGPYPAAQLTALTEVLARTIAQDFPRDRVLLLKPGVTTLPERKEDGLWRAAGHNPRQFRDFDFIFVDGVRAADLELDTAIQLTETLPPPPPGVNATSTLLTVRINPALPVRRHGLTCVSDGLDRILATQSGCWIDLDPAELHGRWRSGAALETLREGHRRALSRWARAVTHRRVGLALSGGGAWGFYHSVILEELARREIPVDIITSASMGSVLGAYYTVHGLNGLEQALRRTQSRTLSVAPFAAIFSTKVIEQLMLAELGSHYLETLPTRFHPVATDLSTGRGMALVEGRLELAVRASCSAPGVFAPTVQGRYRFVDGCVSSDLPVAWLAYFGADLTFASNCYPGGYRPRVTAPGVGQLARLWSTLAPLDRVGDLSCSGSIMLHRNNHNGSDLANVFFDVRRADDEALFKAFNFRDAPRIIDRARADPQLHKAIEDFAHQWKTLKLRGRPHRAAEPARVSA